MSVKKFEAQMELSLVQSTEGYPRSEAHGDLTLQYIIHIKWPAS